MEGRDQELETLIQLMAKLPGLGPRSAPRAVLHLLKRRTQLLNPLAAAMERVARHVRFCEVCGNIGTATRCDICSNPRRANGQVCVVEDVPDLWAIERDLGLSRALSCAGRRVVDPGRGRSGRTADTGVAAACFRDERHRGHPGIGLYRRRPDDCTLHRR